MMSSLGNQNLIYMMVTKENSVANSQATISDSQVHTPTHTLAHSLAHSQGQFPTYAVVTAQHTRVTQMMTNVAKPSLVSDIDDPVKSPVNANKSSIISIVKGSGANQQIFIRKNNSSHDMNSNEGQIRSNSNDTQLIHPRTPVGESPNHHLFVRKNTLQQDLVNEPLNTSQSVHHARISAVDSFSTNLPLVNQLPSYQDATQYGHPPFQIPSPFEGHEPMRPVHQQGGEMRPVHQQGGEMRPVHQQGGEQRPVHQQGGEQRPGHQQGGEIMRPGHQQGGEQRPGHQKGGEQRPVHQQGGEQRSVHQQGGEQKNQVHDNSRTFHQHSDQKIQQVLDLTRSSHSQGDKKSQRHEMLRPMHHQNEQKVHIIHDPSRPVDQQGDHKTQQVQEPSRVIHQKADPKKQIYDTSRSLYQLGEQQKNQQKHESTRPIQQQHESTRQMQQQHAEVKNQLMRDVARPLYSLTNEQKNQQMHYQLGEQKNQLHELSRSLYDQKVQHEPARQLHQQGGEQKVQQLQSPNRSLYQQHAEQKNQQLHDSSRTSHQHNEQNNQHETHQTHQTHQHNEQKKQHESSRSSHQHADQKNQQIHVHKVHHGNARVKYVEFKPIQEGMKYRQMMHHSLHQYNPNLKQTLYYSNHLANNPGNHHLTVQTPQSHSPLSPLHSPPALRPPPQIPSGAAWHSPPSLVPSPEVRPRFDFIGSPQPVSTAAGSPCPPVQVANMVQHKIYPGKGGKQVNIPGNHNILLPRLTGNYQMGVPVHPTSHAVHPTTHPVHPTSHANVAPRSKGTFIQTLPNSPGIQPVYDPSNQTNFSQTGLPGSSVATTVTVTMTYIPIPTSTKDKFVYVPVNSGQPVVLYQNQQQNGKPVLLPQQMLHTGKNLPISKDLSKESPTYTTVYQGIVNSKNPCMTTAVPNIQNNMPKGFKFHHTSHMSQLPNHNLKKSPGFLKLEQKNSSFNMDAFDFEKEKNNLTPVSNKDMLVIPEVRQEGNILMSGKPENHGEVMTMINNQLRLVPPHIGINNQSSQMPIKRNNMGIPMGINNEFILQSPSINAQGKPGIMHGKPGITQGKPGITQGKAGIDTGIINTMKDIRIETVDDKDKKKRGRPSTGEKVPKRVRKKDKGKGIKLTTLGNMMNILAGGQTASNQLLIDAYKKQQQLQLQKHYFDDPLLVLPELPPTPETWSLEDVHKYLHSTDCACYADAIKAEGIDGKAFLLLTREALMEFLGVKLGPALKIAGHASGLRARQRIYCLSLQEQTLKSQVISPPKEKKPRVSSSSTKVTQSQPEKTNSLIVNKDISSPLRNIVASDLIIPTISILPAPPEEKEVRPVTEPLRLLTEPKEPKHPVILKVPEPPILKVPEPPILKVPEPPPPIKIEDTTTSMSNPHIVIELNGETPEELESQSEKLPGAHDTVIKDISKKDNGKIVLEVPGITDNKLDFSQKSLSTSQLHMLTDLEPDGITTQESI